MSTSNPAPGGDDPDTKGKTVPPYEGRKESADVAGQRASSKEGAKTAGATGPVEDAEMKAAAPADTPGGEHAAPAEEQPASQMPETDLDDDGVGPAHIKGTKPAEDVP